MSTPIVEVKNLKKIYTVRQFMKAPQTVKALGGVSFQLSPGKTLAVVGESGCGKSTLAKILLGIETSTSGTVLFHGNDTKAMPQKERQKFIQMIFQDPYGSLNPRKKAWQLISEPLSIATGASSLECRSIAIESMERVGLRAETADRYPHMFSGGQRQRIGIARALVLKPKVLVCDEPVSALDVSIQAQVINLLNNLQRHFGLSYVFISHDLSVVEVLSDSVLVMYLGKVVEIGTRAQIFSNPVHPYTKILQDSTPRVSKGKKNHKMILEGEMPSSMNLPKGCAFSTRCPKVMDRCRKEVPELREGTDSNHQFACFLETTN